MTDTVPLSGILGDIQTHKERHSVYLSEILGDTQGFRHFVCMSLRKLLLNMQTHTDRYIYERSIGDMQTQK